MCRDKLNSQKGSATAGGSYGLGKSVLWRSSRIATVLFSTELRTPVVSDDTGETLQSNRVFGRVELGYHEAPHRRAGTTERFAGKGFFGAPAKVDGVDLSVSSWNNRTLADDLHIGRGHLSGDAGTSICVVGFHDPSGQHETVPAIVEAMKYELARSFWPAITSGKLNVWVEVVEGRTLKSRDQVNPKDHFEGMVALYEAHLNGTLDAGIDAVGSMTSRLVQLQIPQRVATGDYAPHPAMTHDAVVLVRASDNTDRQPNSIHMFRGRGMVVVEDNLRDIPGVRAFQAAVLVGEAAGGATDANAAEVFLRAAEPPAHDTWDGTQDITLQYKRGGIQAIKDFRSAVARAIRTLMMPEVKDLDEGPAVLRNMLRVDIKEPAAHGGQPHVNDAMSSSVAKGRWTVRAGLRVPHTRKAWQGKLVPVANKESGGGDPLSWATLSAVSGCSVSRQGDDGYIKVPKGTREGVFEGDRPEIASRPTEPNHTDHRLPERLRTKDMKAVFPYETLAGEINISRCSSRSNSTAPLRSSSSRMSDRAA